MSVTHIHLLYVVYEIRIMEGENCKTNYKGLPTV